MAGEQGEIREDGQNGVSSDDLDTVRAKLAALEKAHGQLLNEKKRGSKEREELSTALKRWNKIADDHGVEPEELEQLLASRTEADLKVARDKGEIDKLLENQRKSLEKQIEVERDTTRRHQKTIEALTIDAQLNAALDTVKVKSGLRKGAFALHRPRMRLVEDASSDHGLAVVAEIEGEQFPIRDYIKRWAEDDEEAVDYVLVEHGSGGGAQAGANFMRGMKPRSKMTPKEKSDYITAKGKVAYEALPWA